MCKNPSTIVQSAKKTGFPSFKPLPGPESRHYIRKLVHRIRETLETLDLDSINIDSFEDLPDLSNDATDEE
jgi:hypothetical protein